MVVLASDEGAAYDKTVNDATILFHKSLEADPEDVVSIDGLVPNPEDESDETKKKSMIRALEYMGLVPNTPLKEVKVDKVFIGSC